MPTNPFDTTRGGEGVGREKEREIERERELSKRQEFEKCISSKI